MYVSEIERLSRRGRLLGNRKMVMEYISERSASGRGRVEQAKR